MLSIALPCTGHLEDKGGVHQSSHHHRQSLSHAVGGMSGNLETAKMVGAS